MNKTVTINISGIIFHIEEDAYESLSKYLAAIKGYFSNTDGGNEIMGDIEARIAELLQEKINVGKQVILMTDVDYVKNVMGRPEDFGGEPVHEETRSQSEHTEFKQEKIKRRLFRNPDEKVFGGVCGGLSAYFDIDVVWIRLAMFLLIFFGGLSLWVYIVMWIIIPQAKTTADKLAMRGETANINNIFQSFKEEAEDVKTRLSRQGRDVRDTVRDNLAYGRSNAASVLHTLFNILGRVIGLFLLLMGGFFLFIYVMLLFGISIVDGNVDMSVANWKSAIFDSSSDYVLGVIAFIIVAGIPVFMLIYAGIKLLFKIRYSNRWLNLSLGFTWIVGFILGIYVAVSTGKNFEQGSRVKEIAELRNMGDTLVIKADPMSIRLKALNFNNADELETSFENNPSGYRFGETGKTLSLVGLASIDVVETDADSVEMIIYQSARGVNKEVANENAGAIQYAYRRSGNTLIFDQLFAVKQDLKYRDQEVNIKLKLPKGKVVYFDKSIKRILNEADNTIKIWPGHMLERRWKMTNRGLECIDCDNLDKHEDDDEEDLLKNKHLRITDDGIHIKGKNAEIKLDDDGINIKTPEDEYHIGGDKKEKKKDEDKDKETNE